MVVEIHLRVEFQIVRSHDLQFALQAAGRENTGEDAEAPSPPDRSSKKKVTKTKDDGKKEKKEDKKEKKK